MSPLAMLVAIAILVVVMTVFNHQVRYRGRDRCYPALYFMFVASLVAVFYYAFQVDLPAVDGKPCIGWFCRPDLVGGVAWAIVAIVLAAIASFCIFIATMQVVAQLSVEAGMSVQEKRWKEWKWGLALVLLGVSVAGIGYSIDRTFAGWALVVTVVLTVAFVIFKIVRDTINCGNFFMALLIGLAFLLGTAASMVLFLELIHAYFYLTVILVAFLAMSKARKKKPSQR